DSMSNLPSPPEHTIPDSPPPESAADRLRELWRQGQKPDVREVLARNGPLSPAQLLEVLQVDQRERWLRGEGVLAETYLQWCPALLEGPDQTVAMIQQEYELRQQLGQ